MSASGSNSMYMYSTTKSHFPPYQSSKMTVSVLSLEIETSPVSLQKMVFGVESGVHPVSHTHHCTHHTPPHSPRPVSTLRGRCRRPQSTHLNPAPSPPPPPSTPRHTQKPLRQTHRTRPPRVAPTVGEQAAACPRGTKGILTVGLLWAAPAPLGMSTRLMSTLFADT